MKLSYKFLFLLLTLDNRDPLWYGVSHSRFLSLLSRASDMKRYLNVLLKDREAVCPMHFLEDMPISMSFHLYNKDLVTK